MTKKIGFYVLTLLLFLVLTEGLLALIGEVFYKPRFKENLYKAEHDKKFKILALGESTTAITYEGFKDISWPTKLEKQLNDKKLEVKVFNEGRSGVTSAHLIRNLDTQLDYYNPDLVIAMMGVNDLKNLYYKNIDNFLLNTRVVKFFRWMKEFFKTQDMNKMSDKDFNLYEKLPKIFLDDFEKGKSLFLEHMKQAKAPKTLIYSLTWVLQPAETYNLEKYKAVNFVIDYGLKHYPDSEEILNPAFAILYHFDKKKCRELGFNFLKKNDLSDSTLARFSYCLEKEKDFKRFNELVDDFEILSKENRYINHKKLASILSKKKIPLVFMEYPLTPILELKQSLEKSDHEKINFIENMNNFQNELAKRHYEEIFIDKFAGNWGHCTPFGNELIAKNLIPLVMKIISNNQKK